MLYVARSPDLRPAVADHLRTMRTLVSEIASTTAETGGIDLGADAELVGTILVALEDGLRLHRLIDPDSTPPDTYLAALGVLERLLFRPRVP